MILVTGATGFVGHYIIARLMEEKLPVRCFLSEQQQAHIRWDKTSAYAPEIISGTVLDEQAIFKAVSGVHTIIHLENAMWWGRLRDLERVEVAGTRNLLTAARSARVGRVIMLSQLGAAPSSAYPLHRIKGQVEELLRNSGLAYTIIRAGLLYGPEDAFINHIAMMLALNPFFFVMSGHGEVALHPLYIDDLIKAVMFSLEAVDLVDRTLEVGGMEYATLEDLVLTVMRVTNKKRFILPLPPYLLRWTTRFYSFLMPRTLMTPQWFDLLATNRTAKLANMYEYFQFQPRRFEDTLLTYLPQQHFRRRALRYVLRRRPRSV